MLPVSNSFCCYKAETIYCSLKSFLRFLNYNYTHLITTRHHIEVTDYPSGGFGLVLQNSWLRDLENWMSSTSQLSGPAVTTRTLELACHLM